MRPRIKICCISSLSEAHMAIKFGASALGLVGEMPSGPGVISDDLIASIAKKIPPPISTFLLTSKTEANEIIDHIKKVNATVIQLVDEVGFDTYEIIRNSLPALKIVQVVHVADKESVVYARNVSNYVDAILLDSGNPKLKIKQLGGTGKTHNWELSKQIVDSVPIPVFLAGGINLENVLEAYHNVKPFGIDLCSGVRTDGKLDPQKLELFFNQINEL